MFALYVFDADETLRHTIVPGRPCPYGPDEWVLLPNVRERLREIPFGPEGPHLGLASNQDRVGYGQIEEGTARRLLEDLAREATSGDVRARIELCPHRAEDGCDCRKPAPGMLTRLMRHFAVAPGATLFVGDTPEDQQAAQAAAVAFEWAWDFFRRPRPW